MSSQLNISMPKYLKQQATPFFIFGLFAFSSLLIFMIIVYVWVPLSLFDKIIISPFLLLSIYSFIGTVRAIYLFGRGIRLVIDRNNRFNSKKEFFVKIFDALKLEFDTIQIIVDRNIGHFYFGNAIQFYINNNSKERIIILYGSKTFILISRDCIYLLPRIEKLLQANGSKLGLIIS